MLQLLHLNCGGAVYWIQVLTHTFHWQFNINMFLFLSDPAEQEWHWLHLQSSQDISDRLWAPEPEGEASHPLRGAELGWWLVGIRPLQIWECLGHRLVRATKVWLILIGAVCSWLILLVARDQGGSIIKENVATVLPQHEIERPDCLSSLPLVYLLDVVWLRNRALTHHLVAWGQGWCA
jgi:hypothetical protein